MNYSEFFAGKSVLITGVCGTVGAEVLAQVRSATSERIVGIDNNETEIFLGMVRNESDPNIDLFVGDIRDRDKLLSICRGIDIVIHTAALKHVSVCELSPEDAIQTNIVGIRNVIEAAFANNVERVLFTSSDKAVNPTNVMGTSKLMGERLMTAANAQRRSESDPIFATTRFGNVLGSRGSVIPVFKEQILSGKPITLTDPDMTRFIMSLSEAVSLVLQSVPIAHGGEVFVTKMPVVRIEDLAKAMILELATHSGVRGEHVNIEIVGSRPGEKLFEELLNSEEARRTADIGDFLMVLPALSDMYRSTRAMNMNELKMLDRGAEYNSRQETPMSLGEIRHFLAINELTKLTPEDLLKCAS